LLMLGYFNNQAATEIRSRGRLVMSGDLGRCDASGTCRSSAAEDLIIPRRP